MCVAVMTFHLSSGLKSDSPGEQLAGSLGSCAADLGFSPGEKSEREYLLALSAQYQVEHYEDCYNLIGELTTSAHKDGNRQIYWLAYFYPFFFILIFQL